MEKQNLSYQFRFKNGRWRDIINKESKLLSDVLDELNIEVDDNCEYARFRDYYNNRCIIYSAHGGIININVWKIEMY